MLILKYPRILRKAIFIKRYKRFFADVKLIENQDNAIEAVHCANSGSMKSCLVENCDAYTLDSLSTTRKLPHTLELLNLDDGLCCVNTIRANELVENILKLTIAQAHLDFFIQKQFPYSLFSEFNFIKREAVFNANTRFDFCLSSPTHQGESSKKFWIEVKSVSLRLDSSTWAFPDAVTTRGQKHLTELIEAKKRGDEAALFFVIMRGNDIDAQTLAGGFRAAHEIDPRYANLLSEAKKAGVHVILFVPHISPSGFSLRKVFVCE